MRKSDIGIDNLNYFIPTEPPNTANVKQSDYSAKEEAGR